MIDVCRITRNVSGVYDAVLDEDTGALVEPASPELIYHGRCRIGTVRTKDHELHMASAPKFANTYKMLIPASVTAGELGDTVEIVSTAYDPRVLGREFRITDIEMFTHTVYRHLLIQSVEDNIGSLQGL